MVSRRGAIVTLGLGLAGAGAMANTLSGPSYDGPDDLYTALRDQPSERIALTGGEINLVFADGAPGLDRAAVRTWIDQGADAVSRYFGRFPIARYGLLIIAEPGNRVGHGTTYGYAGPVTRIHVGRETDAATFARDWVLVHETLHAALPNLPQRALWLQEGNATYLEPIVRARAGYLSAAEVWRQSLQGMPRGKPRPNEGGMDGTHRWGRLYWGGATFWLLAEIAIAKESGGRRGLRDALRAVSRQSEGIHSNWTPERMMAAGDAAVGGTTLATLHACFASQRVDADLEPLFASLGIVSRGDDVAFVDTAPLAALRRHITEPD